MHALLEAPSHPTNLTDCNALPAPDPNTNRRDKPGALALGKDGHAITGPYTTDRPGAPPTSGVALGGLALRDPPHIQRTLLRGLADAATLG